jgi:hypothetical protein
LTAFIIDAEPGNPVIPDPNGGQNLPDDWVEDDFADFVGAINKLFGTDNLAITTWPILSAHQDHNALTLMQRVAGQVCMFNPQVYWMDHPPTPVGYAQHCMQTWRDAGFTNPLVITGQAYWDDTSPPESAMNDKVKFFVNNFTDWSKIIGYGWYDSGGANSVTEGAMSDDMIASIKNGHLGSKPYMAPP